MSTLNTGTQYKLEVLAIAVGKEKDTKGIKTGNKKSNSTFLDDMLSTET